MIGCIPDNAETADDYAGIIVNWRISGTKEAGRITHQRGVWTVTGDDTLTLEGGPEELILTDSQQEWKDVQDGSIDDIMPESAPEPFHCRIEHDQTHIAIECEHPIETAIENVLQDAVAIRVSVFVRGPRCHPVAHDWAGQRCPHRPCSTPPATSADSCTCAGAELATRRVIAEINSAGLYGLVK